MTLFKIPSPPVDLQCQPVPEVLAQRQTLLDTVENIKEVKTQEDNELASQCGSAIQKMVKDTEKAGKALRDPYNAAAKAIKAAEDAFLDPLIKALLTLSAKVTPYRQEQERKAEAERRAHADAIAKALEAQRLAQEALVKADNFNEQLRADLVAQAVQAKAQEVMRAPIPEAPKTVGQSFTEKELGWECTDVHALYLERPDLCNPPTPKASAIRAVCSPDNPPIPGLKLWWQAKVTWRSR